MKILPIVTGALVVLAGLGIFQNFQHDKALAEARTKTEVAIADAKVATQLAKHYAEKASKDSARAEKAEAAARKAVVKRIVTRPAAAAAIAAAPDTCKPVIEAIQKDLAQADKAAQSFEEAMIEQKQASAKWQAAYVLSQESVRKLSQTSQKLVDVSKDSFWKHILPEVGVGVAVGLDANLHPNVVIGPTLTWRF